MKQHSEEQKSGYFFYNPDAKGRTKLNPLQDLYPPLPNEKYEIIYADPPWDYGGKMQYDRSSIKSENIGFEKKIFISSASFKYPTLKLKELKKLGVAAITSGSVRSFV